MNFSATRTAGRITSVAELPGLERRSDLRSAAVVAGHLALAMSPVLAATALPAGWATLALAIVFGLLMNGVVNLMHEAAHRLVFRRRTLNDILGEWVIGPLLLADFRSYRYCHWQHHRKLGTAEDPKAAYRVSIRGADVVRLVVSVLLLMVAVRSFLHQTDEAGSSAKNRLPLPAFVLRLTVAHATLLAAISWH